MVDIKYIIYLGVFMNILIFNGSPKGKYSVTLQTSLFLQKMFTEHSFSFLDVSKKIKYYEENINEIITEINKADLIIFSYPVYTFLIPSQLLRFIELLKDINIDLSNKYAAQISTSKHFYDVIAHKFIEENCLDLKLKYINGLSADVEDLLSKKGQDEAVSFFNYLLFSIDNNINVIANNDANKIDKKIYATKFTNTEEKDSNKDVLIITNCADEDENLRNMIEDFKSIFYYKVREINIRKYKFDGGCLGCYGCVFTGNCIYNDNFQNLLRKEIAIADAIVYAFTIENHYTHHSFKMYDDRNFCNGHRMDTDGIPTGYIISGNLAKEYNLKTYIEARSDVGGNFLTYIANDYTDDTSKELENLSLRIKYSLENKCMRPKNFYGVAGMKIFRDLVYTMQGIMKADHKFYKKNNLYDFPQRQRVKIMMMKFFGIIISIPSIQKKMKGKFSEYAIMPYKKILDNIKNV